MRRARSADGNDNRVSAISRGFPVTLERGADFMDLSMVDVWYLLLGKVGEDPARYRDDVEIWTDMAGFLESPLDANDKVLYRISNPVWDTLRQRNAESVLPCRMRVHAVVVIPRKQWQTQRKKIRMSGIKLGVRAGEKQMEKAIMSVQGLLSRRLSERIREVAMYGSLDKIGGGARRSRVSLHGVKFQGFRYGQNSYSNALASAAETEYRMVSLAGAPPPLIVGMKKFDRDCVITLYMIPLGMTPAVLLEAISEGTGFAEEIQDSAICLLRKSTRKNNMSARIGFESAEIALSVMDVRHVIETPLPLTVRKYYHSHDHPEDFRGRCAVAIELVQYLRSKYSDLVGTAHGLTLQVWEDGVAASFAHVVVGLIRLIGRTFTPFGPLYTFRGSDSSSGIVSIPLSQMALIVGPQSGISGLLYLLDHGMAFERLGVKAGNVGYRNPFVDMNMAFQSVCFYGARRTMRSLLEGMRALFHVFERLASQLGSPGDVVTADLKRVHNLTKKTVSHGIAMCPSFLQNSIYDPWADYKNLPTLKLLGRATDFSLSEFELENAIILNYRCVYNLLSDQRLSLRGFMQPMVVSELRDEHGAVVAFNGDTTVHPLTPGKPYFFRHGHNLEIDRIYLSSCDMHSTLFVSGFASLMIDATLVAGGEIFGKSTDGIAKGKLRRLASEVLQMEAGRGYVVHSYTSYSLQRTLFEAWDGVLSNVVHPAISIIPKLLKSILETRASNDLTLKENGTRWNCYLMSILFVRMALCVELAELSRRRLLKSFKTYLNVRAGVAEADISLSISHFGPELIIPPLEDDDSAFDLEALGNMSDEEIEEANKADDRASSKREAKRAEAAKKRKFDKIYIASFASGPFQLMTDYKKDTNIRLLLQHLCEAFFENWLKAFKAAGAASNQRHHNMENANRMQNQNEAGQARAAERWSEEWTGAGIVGLYFHKCWAEQLAIASWNLPQAIRMAWEADVDASRFIKCGVVQGEIRVIRIQVGHPQAEGQQLEFCACGKLTHSTDQPGFQWIPLNSVLMAQIIAWQPTLTLPATVATESDLNRTMDRVAGKILLRRQAREDAVEAQAQEQIAGFLLEALGFSVPERGLSASILREFRKNQPDYLFVNEPWPNTLPDQIDYLADRSDPDDWERKGTLQNWI